MTFKVDLPKEKSSIIKVIGVGGGGGNAVNYMFKEGIKGVDFFICNTDAQALEASPIPNKIQIGSALTEGRGAGSDPAVGKKAAQENVKDLLDLLGVNTKMVFVTAGMGGGTGTGAAPVIAKAARDIGILTVGIVTKPFYFEGNKRKMAAEQGIDELRECVDSLLVVSNDRIKEIHGNLPISKAFGYADDILTTAAKGIAEIITIAGEINVDFEDIKNAMANSGAAILGSGMAEGEDRAMRAVKTALNSPLLDDNKIHGASSLLVNISYGENEVTMEEYSAINEYLQEEAGYDASLKCGLCFDEKLGNSISVTVIATGFSSGENKFKAENTFETQEIPSEIKESEVKSQVNKQVTIFEVVNEEKTSESDDVVEKQKKRIIYLKELNTKAMSPNGMEEMEIEPAFVRQNIRIDNHSHSSEEEISRISLFDEPNKKPELRTNNSFLHDNVD